MFYRFRVIALFSWKVVNYNPPHLHLHPHRGWSRSNFAMNFGVRKLESRGYRVALFAWSYVYRFDTILKCDRHTTMAYTALSIVSRSKNHARMILHAYIDTSPLGRSFLPCNAMLSVVYAVFMCPPVCLCVCKATKNAKSGWFDALCQMVMFRWPCVTLNPPNDLNFCIFCRLSYLRRE